MRTIKRTIRFKRDYRREKSSQHGKRVDALLVEVVNLRAVDAVLRGGISITRWPANGAITAIAT
jgi:hypothetical protein